jgi:tetratricopeptide (TPR) repeat protein
VVEGRLRHPPTDYWEGPVPLVEASRRLEAIASRESRGGATALAGAAACEVLLGRTVAAERLAKLAVAASPQSPAPHALLAQVALDRGDARRALAHAQAAVDSRALDPVALVARARALEGLGRNLDAEQAFRAAAEAGPELVTPRLGLGRLLARRGEATEAGALLEPLLREDPSLAEVRGALLALASAAAPKPAAP